MLLALSSGACSSGEPGGTVPASPGAGAGGNAMAAAGGTHGVAPQPTTGGATTGGGAGGRGNEAGASGMTNVGGSSAMLTLKQPIDRGEGRLVLEFGSTYFEVTPAHGARITSLQEAGQELLALSGASNYADAIGSTFWPSPQSWPWPPPAEIDNYAYAAVVDPAGVITLQGDSNAATSLKVKKTFTANLTRESLELEYAMTNTGSAQVQWAPWEITRMPANGLAFWPTGGAPFGDSPMPTDVTEGHTWCDPSKTTGEGKLFADGAGGYLAYAVGDRLLIKAFQDQPASAAAPGEAEIELYVNPDHSYVEVENQGAYSSIAPGQTLSWRVVWYLRKLPPGVTASAGNADLVAFVAKTLE